MDPTGKMTRSPGIKERSGARISKTTAGKAAVGARRMTGTATSPTSPTTPGAKRSRRSKTGARRVRPGRTRRAGARATPAPKAGGLRTMAPKPGVTTKTKTSASGLRRTRMMQRNGVQMLPPAVPPDLVPPSAAMPHGEVQGTPRLTKQSLRRPRKSWIACLEATLTP